MTFADGRREIGTVKAVDGDGDLAVIGVDTKGATPLEWGAGDGVALGAAVFGAAAANGSGTRITFGTVSAVERAFRGPGGRRIAGSIEHTAPLAPGLFWRCPARRRGTARRAQHQPDRRRLLPRPARGRRAARAR